MRHDAQKRLVPAAALTAIAGILAATALAAQPAASSSYGGTFKGNKGYVSLFVGKGGATITYARVQYACKGKGAAVEAPSDFKPVPISSKGRFVIKFKGDITNEQAQKTGKQGRVRIVGRFRTSKLARGTARVRSKSCAKKSRRYTVRGPQVEG
jgi:hypothetical protein